MADTLTATETIRAAAKQIRDRANRAAAIAPGEWYADHTIGVYAHGDDTTSGCPAVVTDHRADLAVLEHIAGFGPLVADAVADWLDSVADGNGVDPRALAVARAFLAPTSTEAERVAVTA